MYYGKFHKKALDLHALFYHDFFNSDLLKKLLRQILHWKLSDASWWDLICSFVVLTGRELLSLHWSENFGTRIFCSTETSLTVLPSSKWISESYSKSSSLISISFTWIFSRDSFPVYIFSSSINSTVSSEGSHFNSLPVYLWCWESCSLSGPVCEI